MSIAAVGSLGKRWACRWLYKLDYFFCLFPI
jgi:hypothetical protein